MSRKQSLVGNKRNRSVIKNCLIDLGEEPIIEIINYISDKNITEDQICIYLEILLHLETSIEILKKTKAGICLRNIKKNTNNERLSNLCKTLLFNYRNLVQTEINARKKEKSEKPEKKKRKIV